MWILMSLGKDDWHWFEANYLRKNVEVFFFVVAVVVLFSFDEGDQRKGLLNARQETHEANPSPHCTLVFKITFKYFLEWCTDVLLVKSIDVSSSGP